MKFKNIESSRLFSCHHVSINTQVMTINVHRKGLNMEKKNTPKDSIIISGD